MNAAKLASAAIPMLLLAMELSAQPALRLKSGGLHRTQGPAFGRSPERRHIVVQYPELPTEQDVAKLRERGARVLQYLPDFAYVVSVPASFSAEGLGVHWVGPLGAADKLSPALKIGADPSSGRFVLIEFYPDVDMSDARSVALERQLQIQENGDLRDHDLLVSGSDSAIAGLAQWDEVAYVFPASDELIQGVPVSSCAGAMTAQGQIGQSVARAGDGWDGPGLNGADLSYAFATLPDQLPADSVRGEVVRAFQEWAKYAKLSFTPTTDLNAARSLTVMFAHGDHGDSYPFTTSAVLAHTFYPFPVNVEPLAGDLHFNADENWRIGADTDMFTVALHEAGHALGLGHSDRPGAVMYPYYRRASALTDDDISAILSLYAAQSAPAPDPLVLAIVDPGPSTTADTVTLTGTLVGGSTPSQLIWSSDKGSSGSLAGSDHWTIPAIPLGTGPNTINVAAIDAQQVTVSKSVTITRVQAQTQTPLLLKITGPSAAGSYTASSATITLSGTLSGGSAPLAVNWSSSRGPHGQASGTSNWTAGPLTLDVGTTRFSVTASSNSGSPVTQFLDVSYTPQPATPPPSPTPTPVPTPVPTPSNDTTAPSLTVLSPAMTNVTTSDTSIVVSGTATDNVGVTQVTWSTSTGDSGTAIGTGTWSTPPIHLYTGSNMIVIRAHDAAGNSSWRSVGVTRR